MTLRADQAFVRGDLIEPSVSPVYPAGLVDKDLPRQVVCVRFVVGKDGAVSDVAPEARSPDCPTVGEAQAPFFAAVVDAVSRWQFFSNQVCTFPPGTPADRRCSDKGVDVQPVAISLIYRFEFFLRNGAGVVERRAP